MDEILNGIEYTLLGSRAWGGSKDYSDYDIAILQSEFNKIQGVSYTSSNQIVEYFKMGNNERVCAFTSRFTFDFIIYYKEEDYLKTKLLDYLMRTQTPKEVSTDKFKRIEYCEGFSERLWVQLT